METKNSTPNHINFDRHEIYSTEMMNMNMDLIAESKRNNNGLTNSLYGLFDGYLYNSIKESNDPKIQKLVMMIEKEIAKSKIQISENNIFIYDMAKAKADGGYSKEKVIEFAYELSLNKFQAEKIINKIY
tara:strand:+ start:350 stop:739 length:390 start_codon:yes stop_codon:yes gene_type:complete